MSSLCLNTYTNNLTISIQSIDPLLTTWTRFDSCCAAMLELEKRWDLKPDGS